jgi:hypothetical protein
VGSLENRVQEIERGCGIRHERLQADQRQTDRMAANLDNLVGWTKKMDAKLDRIAEQNAAQSAAIDGQEKWLQNLDAAHQTHVRDREVHHG